jgi:beta-1,4-N-acetylglucosaminyltransferase
MLLPIAAATFLTLLLALILATTARLHAILPPNRPRPRRRRGIVPSANPITRATRSRRLEKASRDEGTFSSPSYPYTHILVVLGSGGHTAEMLLMLQTLDMARWKKRSWVVSSGDSFSAGLAAEFEARLRDSGGMFEVVELPRARRVHQSIFTAPATSLSCLWASLKILERDSPDVVLTNGPGTGVIVVLASLILRFLGLAGSERTRCVYVESLARCNKLSLSGRLLSKVVDRFLVQWPELEKGRAEFRGCFALDAARSVELDGTEKDTALESDAWITYDI